MQKEFASSKWDKEILGSEKYKEVKKLNEMLLKLYFLIANQKEQLRLPKNGNIGWKDVENIHLDLSGLLKAA